MYHVYDIYITDITTTSPQPNEVEIPTSIRKLSVKKVHFKEVCCIIIICDWIYENRPFRHKK